MYYLSRSALVGNGWNFRKRIQFEVNQIFILLKQFSMNRVARWQHRSLSNSCHVCMLADAVGSESISGTNKCYRLTVFKTNSCPVSPGDQKLGWTSQFDPGRVKIIIDYTRREIFWAFLGNWEKIWVWNTGLSLWALLVRLLSRKYHRTPLMISQHWSR